MCRQEATPAHSEQDAGGKEEQPEEPVVSFAQSSPDADVSFNDQQHCLQDNLEPRLERWEVSTLLCALASCWAPHVSSPVNPSLMRRYRCG